MHEAGALACAAVSADAAAGAVALEVEFLAAAQLHAAAGGEAADGVAGNAVGHCVAMGAGAVGVFAREVEEVYAGEDDEEAAEEGDGVDG